MHFKLAAYGIGRVRQIFMAATRVRLLGSSFFSIISYDFGRKCELVVWRMARENNLNFYGLIIFSL